MKILYFKNFSNETFTYSWNSEPRTFAPGEGEYMEEPVANHFAKHLVDREMQRDNKYQVTDPIRDEFIKKALIEPEIPQNLSHLAKENIALNMNMGEVSEEKPEKKRGRPAKQEKPVEETEFSDLKS